MSRLENIIKEKDTLIDKLSKEMATSIKISNDHCKKLIDNTGRE